MRRALHGRRGHRPSLHGLDTSEQSVGFAVDARGEVQGIRARGRRTAELETPQPRDGDCTTVSVTQLSAQLPVGAESADAAVAKVADENIAAEPAERVRRARHAPRRIERTTGCETAQQVTVGIEHVDETMTLACHVIVLLCILQRVGHKQITVDDADAERGIPGRNVRIAEGAVELYLFERRVEHVNRAGAEVGGEEEDSLGVGSKRQTLIYRTTASSRVIDLEDRVHAID